MSALDHLASNGRIEWLAGLNTAEVAAKHSHRRTSIIGTIGPKTNSVEAIGKLADAGLNIVRMNFSHGSYEYHGSVIEHARAAQVSTTAILEYLLVATADQYPPITG